MQRSHLVKNLAVCACALALCAGTAVARADRRHPRSYGPVLVIAPMPGPYYTRYYHGPPSGTYGSPYYGLANRRYFAPPDSYVPYGSRTMYGRTDSPAPPGEPYVVYTPRPVEYAPRPAENWDPLSDPLLRGTMIENQLRWGTALPPHVPSLRTRHYPRPSSPEQKAKSLHAQAQGDVWLRQLKFLNAYERYKVAVTAASDRPEPYFRLGFALSAIGSFDSAVKYIKQGLDLDPQWPAHGDRLDVLFGEENRLAVLNLTERVANWVREDIRDPDRLFLMGVILHFDGDTRSSEFFEAAYRLAGSGDHLLAFLHPTNGPEVVPPGASQPAYQNGGSPPPAREPNDGFFGAPGHEYRDPAQGRRIPPGAMPRFAPPDFGPPGERQGLFSPPRQLPSDQGRMNQPPPDQQLPNQSAPYPFPPRRRYSPAPTAPSDNPVNGPLNRAAPRNPQPVNPQPRQAPPAETKPAAPALPVPPLPVPELPPDEPQRNDTGTAPNGAAPNGPAPTGGPSAGGPILPSPQGAGGTTVQSP